MNAEGDVEELRLRQLERFNLLDTPREAVFDRITRLVAAVLDVPIAAVTLVDRDRQWFKSEIGLGVNETPRSQSFCAHAMLGKHPMVVPDALSDPRFSSNPLVLGHPDIRFYVGAPLCAADGTPLGALCGIDTKPRDIGTRELALLDDLANLAMEQLQLRQLATLDGLTGTMRRLPFLASAGRDIALARRRGDGLSCLMIDADYFKSINDQWGHPTGDQVLVRLAEAIASELRFSDTLGRLGGEEFCVFLPSTDLEGALNVAERVRAAVDRVCVRASAGNVRVTASIGVTQLQAGDKAPEDMILRADAALYQAKSSGRNRVECSLTPGETRSKAG